MPGALAPHDRYSGLGWMDRPEEVGVDLSTKILNAGVFSRSEIAIAGQARDNVQSVKSSDAMSQNETANAGVRNSVTMAEQIANKQARSRPAKLTNFKVLPEQADTRATTKDQLHPARAFRSRPSTGPRTIGSHFLAHQRC